MKRYYILNNKLTTQKGVGGEIYYTKEWYVVASRGEPIGNNCFYRKKKLRGLEYLELYDMATGVFICTRKTIEELEEYVRSEKFNNQLERARNREFYKLMLERYKKAVKEYNERVK